MERKRKRWYTKHIGNNCEEKKRLEWEVKQSGRDGEGELKKVASLLKKILTNCFKHRNLPITKEIHKPMAVYVNLRNPKW